jgi:predicted dehydrogenase
MKDKGKNQVTRRGFLASTGAAMAFTIIKPQLVFGTAANSRINLGLIGCGMRGAWIADLFQKHGGYNLVAAVDYFQDRVDKFADQLNEDSSKKYSIPAQNRFTTLSGYKKMLDSKLVDAIAIESPPFFHPQQAQAGIDAGVHVYLAKPVAVDVPGTRSIQASSQEATKKKLCFLVDFQTRTNEYFIEAVKRVHDGAIGDIVFGESTYHYGRLNKQAEEATPEARLKNWTFDKALSGEIVVEQSVHTLDVMSWIMNMPPLHVTGTGGRKVRVDVGDCWDYYTLLYEYPNQVGVTFSTRQFDAWGTQPEGICNRMFGTKGVIETAYGGDVRIRGTKDNFYRGGSTSQLYPEGAIANIAAFYKSITEKNYTNPTVADSVRSNFVTIMGRMAAYQNRRVTWDEVMGNEERLDGKLEGLKA